MKEKTYFLNTFLAVVLGVALLAEVLVRTFAPDFIILKLDIPAMTAISLAALLMDHYIVKDAPRCYICIPVFAAITFGLLPFAACFVGMGEALKLAVLGAVVFTVTTWLFTSMMDRLSTGPAAKLAPVVSAMGLFLASQVFMGF